MDACPICGFSLADKRFRSDRSHRCPEKTLERIEKEHAAKQREADEYNAVDDDHKDFESRLAEGFRHYE